MESTEKQIMGLYDTFFGKFRFFHKFIQILLNMNRTIARLTSELSDLKTKYDDNIKSLMAELNNSEQTAKIDPSTQRNFSSSTEIMERMYNVYHNPTTQE